MSEFLTNYPLAMVAIALAMASGLLTAGIWIGRVNEHRKNVSDFMNEIGDDIKNILGRLESR